MIHRHLGLGLCALVFATSPLLAQDTQDAAPDTAATGGDAMTPDQRFSYMVGMEVGRSLQQLNSDIDVDALTQAIKDVLSGAEPKLSEAEVAQLKQAFVAQRQQQAQVQAQTQATENRRAGDEFLTANAEKEEVQTTESGLQYIVVAQGEGERPESTDTVRVHYRGTLLDGTEFDSSYARGQPAEFPVNQVIPGWTEALQLMPVGSTYKLFIPSDLAYGPRGVGDRIAPNSTLIFDVELLDIVE
ncbi:MAG: FKBP-type peptidyl-prolyl cis-trans isomerase [Candidatus Competibacterales bacterium]